MGELKKRRSDEEIVNRLTLNFVELSSATIKTAILPKELYAKYMCFSTEEIKIQKEDHERQARAADNGLVIFQRRRNAGTFNNIHYT
jgi:hypothetical protein